MGNQSDNRALVCPACSSGRMKITDSRPSKVGFRRRRYVCSSCNTKLSTIEIVVESVGPAGVGQALVKAVLEKASQIQLAAELQKRNVVPIPAITISALAEKYKKQEAPSIQAKPEQKNPRPFIQYKKSNLPTTDIPTPGPRRKVEDLLEDKDIEDGFKEVWDD